MQERVTHSRSQLVVSGPGQSLQASLTHLQSTTCLLLNSDATEDDVLGKLICSVQHASLIKLFIYVQRKNA